MAKPKPIIQRIHDAYRPGIGYHELMDAVFPSDQFPNAFRGRTEGGPPGCAMAFGRALNRLGAFVAYHRPGVPVSIDWDKPRNRRLSGKEK